MRLYYFELEVEGKLYDTKVVSAENSWYAWQKMKELLEGSWDAEMTEMGLSQWRQVGAADASSMVFTGYHSCPTGILNSVEEVSK